MNINDCKRQIRAGLGLRHDADPFVRYTNRARVRESIRAIRRRRIEDAERKVLISGTLPLPEMMLAMA